MGLDISAFSFIKFEREYDESYDYTKWTSLRPNPHFPEQTDGLVEGNYSFQNRFNFRAGSYSGYNYFRDQLCQSAHGITANEFFEKADEYKGKPFAELINFSDCEGFIGSITSAKLLKDFVEHESAFKDYVGSRGLDTYEIESYNNWRRGFEMASFAGAVTFH